MSLQLTDGFGCINVEKSALYLQILAMVVRYLLKFQRSEFDILVISPLALVDEILYSVLIKLLNN